MRWGTVIFALAASALPTSALGADEDPICADRPGKTTPTCTVPAGMIQIETGLIDWSRDHRVDALELGGTAVKYGVNDRLHVEIDLPAYTNIHHGPSGLGDSALALKYRLTPTSAPVQIGLRPFVKLPTARHSLGNGKVEGGVALLADSTFAGSSVGWDLAPEVDVVADSDGSGYHPAAVAAASVGVPLSRRLTVSAELWGTWDFAASGTNRQYSIDAAAALLLSENAQLDAGVNLDLQDSADAEFYTGFAVRF